MWERGMWERAFGTDDSSWVVVFVDAFLGDLEERDGACVEVLFRYVGFESFGAHERLGVILADKSLGFKVDKRLLDC
jgi:hypothetical protein